MIYYSLQYKTIKININRWAFSIGAYSRELTQYWSDANLLHETMKVSECLDCHIQLGNVGMFQWRIVS